MFSFVKLPDLGREILNIIHTIDQDKLSYLQVYEEP